MTPIAPFVNHLITWPEVSRNGGDPKSPAADLDCDACLGECRPGAQRPFQADGCPEGDGGAPGKSGAEREAGQREQRARSYGAVGEPAGHLPGGDAFLALRQGKFCGPIRGPFGMRGSGTLRRRPAGPLLAQRESAGW